MKLIKFVLNKEGVRELMKSEPMQAIIQSHVSRVMNNAGPGYSGDTRAGKNRAVGLVRVASKEAYKDNLENNTLLKSL